MGADWHPYVEENINGNWQPRWKPMPHPEFWWDALVRRKLEDGSVRLLFPRAAEADHRELLVKTYQTIPWDKVKEEFSDHPDIDRVWFESTNYKYWRSLKTIPNGEYRYSSNPSKGWQETFRSRNYSWFSLFGVRTSDDVRIGTNRGFPENASQLLRHEYYRYEGDAHTCSWIMVTDLISQYKELSRTTKQNIGPEKINWLRRYADSPNTRLVFWFDN